MSGGGKPRHIELVRKLKVGERLFAYVSGSGFVGFGEVTAEAVPRANFVPHGQTRRLLELPRSGAIPPDRLNDPNRWEWCVGVRWIRAVDRSQGVLKSRGPRSTLGRIRQPELVAELLKLLGCNADD